MMMMSWHAEKGWLNYYARCHVITLMLEHSEFSSIKASYAIYFTFYNYFHSTFVLCNQYTQTVKINKAMKFHNAKK